MIILKNKDSITPTCVKEMLERRMSKQILKEEDREKMIKDPKTIPQQNEQLQHLCLFIKRLSISLKL